MLIDSHCHPQFPQYDKDREEVIKRALDADIQMICVGTDLETSKSAIELAQKNEGIWASVGLHPNDVSGQFAVDSFQSLFKETRVVAVGEVGLDYYRTSEMEKQKRQREVFKEFLELAKQTDKPVIIHCRNAAPKFSSENLGGQAHNDMIQILKPVTCNLKPVGCGVIHSFTGTWQQAQQYFDLGFYIGLNGIITFTDQYNETVINAPLDRLLLETDAPYLAPVPYRGKRNEPLHAIEVAQKIAELKGVPVEEIAEQTTKNTQKLFGINE